MACGVGDYSRSLAGALSECGGTEVAVLTSAAAGAASDGASYPIFPAIKHWRSDEAAAVTEVIGQWRPDLVHIQYPTLGYRGDLAARLPALLSRLGVPVVQTWHEPFPLYFPVRVSLATRVFGMGLPRGDVIVVRPDYFAKLRPWYRMVLARKRFHFIPNAPTIPRADLTESERAQVRKRYAASGKKLLAFFGFFFAHKGIDELLEILDPEVHHLVLVGEVDDSDRFQADLARRLREPPLARSVTLTGFLPPQDVAGILSAADAVVLPFRHGGGSWNTSLKAAILQGTFVLTTSTSRHGFDPEANVYYARPMDTADLKRALADHLGQRNRSPSPEAAGPGWAEIARRHLDVYSGRA
jgi:glycosyltransferase involved in cell wall biosynthesis